MFWGLSKDGEKVVDISRGKVVWAGNWDQLGDH